MAVQTVAIATRPAKALAIAAQTLPRCAPKLPPVVTANAKKNLVNLARYVRKTAAIAQLFAATAPASRAKTAKVAKKTAASVQVAAMESATPFWASRARPAPQIVALAPPYAATAIAKSAKAARFATKTVAAARHVEINSVPRPSHAPLARRTAASALQPAEMANAGRVKLAVTALRTADSVRFVAIKPATPAKTKTARPVA